eukprot:gene26560-biopygen16862
MNSCHEEGVRDRNRARIEAADPADPAHFISTLFFPISSQCRSRGIGMMLGKTNGKGHLQVWKGCGAAVSDEMLSHGGGWLHPAFGRK